MVTLVIPFRMSVKSICYISKSTGTRPFVSTMIQFLHQDLLMLIPTAQYWLVKRYQRVELKDFLRIITIVTIPKFQTLSKTAYKLSRLYQRAFAAGQSQQTRQKISQKTGGFPQLSDKFKKLGYRVRGREINQQNVPAQNRT